MRGIIVGGRSVIDKMMKLARPIFLLLLASGSVSSNLQLPAGKVIEKVTCRSDETLSYAVYLPTAYSPERRWPIIYAFDPGARGQAPVDRFREAAEKYGYIVVGSNNSRNGPWPPTLAALRAMWDDTHARFSLDEQQVYAAGFSGGARVACQIGYLLKGSIAGVIGCGAGFPSELEPSSATPFVYFGTVGTDDFNYPELKRLDELLDTARVPNRVVVFEGGHAWPPAEICMRAIEWLELQAMKSGRREKDSALVDGLFRTGEAGARADEATGKLYEAYVRYQALSEDFKGLNDVSEFERRLTSLKETKVVKQALKQERDQESQQRTRLTELFRLRAALRDRQTTSELSPGEGGAGESGNRSSAAAVVDAPQNREAPPDQVDSRSTALVDLRSALAGLRKRSEAKEATPERAVARRVLSQFIISSSELSMMLVRAGKYDMAAANLAIDAELMPDNPRIRYNLACAYSLKGDKKRALEALEKAVQKGFNSVSELESNKDLQPVRDEPRYRAIIDRLKNQ
jgi:tetratricopeptide (TPR) repeat protein